MHAEGSQVCGCVCNIDIACLSCPCLLPPTTAPPAALSRARAGTMQARCVTVQTYHRMSRHLAIDGSAAARDASALCALTAQHCCTFNDHKSPGSWQGGGRRCPIAATVSHLESALSGGAAGAGNAAAAPLWSCRLWGRRWLAIIIAGDVDGRSGYVWNAGGVLPMPEHCLSDQMVCRRLSV